MAWGDFDSLYKDEDVGLRRDHATKNGLTPGTLVSYGSLEKNRVMSIWEGPDFKANCFEMMPGVAFVISVDCEADPMNDWLMLFMTSRKGVSFGWLPSDLVKKV